MLGVLSNSDGRAESVTAAVNIFKTGGATFIVHCGDVGGRHVLDALGTYPSAFVWGDRDRDRMGLMRYGHSVGVDCLGLIGDLEFEDKKIAVVHGDDRKLVRKLLDEQQHDYLLCGHELGVEDYTVGKTRVINPGPLHGAQARSAMLLDPSSGKFKLVAI
ncbi:MAG TPA: metallophosphoesterase family protein [Tepidisphaeraceae bacterium]|nr:metallophosphoesterase family protein [Tepidisphaeraceae bacterium]